LDPRTLWSQTSNLVELTGSDAPLATVLSEVVKAARVVTGDCRRAALFIHDLDDACLNLGVNGGLSAEYVKAIQGFKVGEHQPSCGHAAFIADEVIVPEIRLDPRWAPYIGLADANSIAACWSFPILSNAGVLGTIAVYHEQPCEPRPGEAEAMRYLATLASAAIGRSKLKEIFDEELKQLPVEADLSFPGTRSGEGTESLRKLMAASRNAH
jgi:two-component system, sensor histidine kinase PdtaS